MNTDDLIARLAASPAIAPHAGVERRIAPALLAGFVVTVLLFETVLGLRPDLAAALSQPVVLAKSVLPLALSALALVLVLRAARPGAAAGLSGRLIWGVPVVAASLFVAAFALTDPSRRLTLFLGQSIPICLPAIVTLSLPMLAGLIITLRRGAPTRPAGCGALAGLTAAGLATMVYSLFCTEDSPLFYAVWYSLGICLATAIGALAGRHWLRW